MFSTFFFKALNDKLVPVASDVETISVADSPVEVESLSSNSGEKDPMSLSSAFEEQEGRMCHQLFQAHDLD